MEVEGPLSGAALVRGWTHPEGSTVPQNKLEQFTGYLAAS